MDPQRVYKLLGFNPKGLEEWQLVLAPSTFAYALEADRLASRAEGMIDKLFPGRPQHNNEVDAFRHAWWSFMVTREFGPEKAKEFGDAHEVSDPNPDSERLMDLYNNYIGRSLALDPKNKGRPAEDVIMEALNNELLQTRPLNIPEPLGGAPPSRYDD